jgi:hypothetical protein
MVSDMNTSEKAVKGIHPARSVKANVETKGGNDDEE